MVALANPIRGALASVGRVFAAVGDPWADGPWWSSSSPTYTTAAGAKVTTPGAIEHSAVYACLQLLANGTVGTPLKLFQRQADDSRVVARDHPLAHVLSEAPNPYQTVAVWKSQLIVDVLLYGNYYAQKKLNGGDLDSLWPIHPDSIRKVELLPSGNLRYTVRQDDGTDRIVNGEDMLHVRGLSLNGLTGMPLLTYAKNAIGLGLAAGSYGAGFFSRAPRPAGIVTHPGNLSIEAMQRFKSKVEADHGGANAGKSILVVDEGVTWTATPVMGNDEAELINTLKWSTTQICQYFGVPPHLIGESTLSTWGSGVAEMNVMFFMLVMGPRFITIQEELERSLLTEQDRSEAYYIEFVPNGLQWMTPSQRADYYQKMAGGAAPAMTRAEVRALENLPFIPGTDVLLEPLNMGGNPDTTQNQKQPNPANQGQAALPSAASARQRLVVEDSIGRIVTSEINQMTRLAARSAGDFGVWWEEIDAFYAKQAPILANLLHISTAAAQGYCDSQARALKAGGAGVMLDWKRTSVVELLALVDREKGEDS